MRPGKLFSIHSASLASPPAPTFAVVKKFLRDEIVSSFSSWISDRSFPGVKDCKDCLWTTLSPSCARLASISPVETERVALQSPEDMSTTPRHGSDPPPAPSISSSSTQTPSPCFKMMISFKIFLQ